MKDLIKKCWSCKSTNLTVEESKVYSIRGTKKQKEELRKKYLMLRATCKDCGFCWYEGYNRKTLKRISD